jgi:hypothetical protein
MGVENLNHRPLLESPVIVYLMRKQKNKQQATNAISGFYKKKNYVTL